MGSKPSTRKNNKAAVYLPTPVVHTTSYRQPSRSPSFNLNRRRSHDDDPAEREAKMVAMLNTFASLKEQRIREVNRKAQSKFQKAWVRQIEQKWSTNEQHDDWLSSLSPEILLGVLLFLDPRSLVNLCCTSSAFRFIAKERRLWRSLYFSRWLTVPFWPEGNTVIPYDKEASARMELPWLKLYMLRLKLTVEAKELLCLIKLFLTQTNEQSYKGLKRFMITTAPEFSNFLQLHSDVSSGLSLFNQKLWKDMLSVAHVLLHKDQSRLFDTTPSHTVSVVDELCGNLNMKLAQNARRHKSVVEREFDAGQNTFEELFVTIMLAAESSTGTTVRDLATKELKELWTEQKQRMGGGKRNKILFRTNSTTEVRKNMYERVDKATLAYGRRQRPERRFSK